MGSVPARMLVQRSGQNIGRRSVGSRAPGPPEGRILELDTRLPIKRKLKLQVRVSEVKVGGIQVGRERARAGACAREHAREHARAPVESGNAETP